MTTAFERKLVSDAQLHKEWQAEIDRRDDIIYSDKQIIADLRAEIEALTVDENIIVGACNILDTAKMDLGNQWSEWDQSIRDGLSDILRRAAIRSLKTKEPT